jgi:hypothetical protein
MEIQFGVAQLEELYGCGVRGKCAERRQGCGDNGAENPPGVRAAGCGHFSYPSRFHFQSFSLSERESRKRSQAVCCLNPDLPTRSKQHSQIPVARGGCENFPEQILCQN